MSYFGIGDRVRLKAAYAGSVEDFFGIKRDTILVVAEIELDEGIVHLIINWRGQFLSLRAEFFDAVGQTGFCLDEIDP